MNSDFIQSFIVKLIIMGGTAWATKHAYTVDGSTLQVFAGSLVAAGAAGLRLYQGYSMKKVPEASKAIEVPALHPAANAQVGDTVQITGKVVG